MHLRMDESATFWYFSAMTQPPKIPLWHLYGEQTPLPDILHIERVVDRAAGLDWRIAPHRHAHLHQVFLLISGAAELQINGKTIAANPPQVMNMPRGHAHGFQFSAGTEGYVLTLPAADFPDLFGPQSDARALLDRPFLAPAPSDLPDLFVAIEDLHATRAPLRSLRLRAAALTLFARLIETCAPQAPKGDARLSQFEDLIRRHLTQGWTLPEYARALGLSERHLRRLCQDQTGMSANAIITATRLREACRLLAYTRMRVQDVGFALGFDDPAYFARSFRRGMGVSPQEYRRQLDG